jgi:acetyl-CoA acyltransferase
MPSIILGFKIQNSKIIMKTAYIVKAYRTAVGKAPKSFRFKRPDELAETIEFMMNELPDFDKTH